MKKFLVMMAVVATVMSLVSCSQEKSIYQQETKYLPVLLQGSKKWSILNVETGQLVAKDAFSEAPSPVVDDMFCARTRLIKKCMAAPHASATDMPS